MSLDVSLYADIDGKRTEVFDRNITHNLNSMAKLAGVYQHLWRPDEIPISRAGDLIAPLKAGLIFMAYNQQLCEALNPENGWGNYAGLLEFVTEYFIACAEYPDATIEVSR